MSNQIFPAMKYRVQESIFDGKSMLDETNFYHQRQGAPSELTKKLTYILGDYNKSFPISTMTLGGVGYGNEKSAVELDDVQYTYPVMGRDNKVSFVYETLYQVGDKPGLGNQPFYIILSDNWIKRFYIIESELGIQAYVLETPEPYAAGGYRYKVQLDPAGPKDFCPLTQLNVGTKWIAVNTAVPESESRTTESTMAMPGLFKNQMSFMRTGMSWAGNAANKVMRIKAKTDKGETDMWMDFALWQFEKKWLEDCEHYYWYSRYNRLADGTVPLKDLYSGKVIPRGSGILEQIGNKSTYSKLSYNTLSNKIGDALFGQTDSGDMTITLMTGTGGRREFHRTMVEAGATLLTNFQGVADKFVTGSGRNLMLGGFFDGFYHVDGMTVKVKYNPIFDTGRKALVSPTHPESGLPLESYRMVFLDDSDVDGQPNIQHVAQKGRSFRHGVIKGMTQIPRSLEIMLKGNSAGIDDSALLATDVDKASYTRMKSAGIQILRANRCFDLECVAGL